MGCTLLVRWHGLSFSYLATYVLWWKLGCQARCNGGLLPPFDHWNKWPTAFVLVNVPDYVSPRLLLSHGRSCLTPRRYCQALPILYQENIYHFRGAPSLLALRTSISRIHWNLIRHIHLSTFYTCDAGWYIQDQCWPPENPINWEKMCEYIQELPQLDSLKLDIVFKITSGYAHLSHRMNNLFTRALGPLKNVKAKVFEVESNVQPAPEVWASLGRVNFKIVVRERELNERLYGGNPRLEISSRGNTVFVHKIPFCC